MGNPDVWAGVTMILTAALGTIWFVAWAMVNDLREQLDRRERQLAEREHLLETREGMIRGLMDRNRRQRKLLDDVLRKP